jgi:hypothetical protein
VLIEVLAPEGGLFISIIKDPYTVSAKPIRDAVYVFAVFAGKGQGNIELEPWIYVGGHDNLVQPSGGRRPRTAACGGRPQGGLEAVEDVLMVISGTSSASS